MANNTSKRGFASMDPDKQRAIASMGGSASGGNFKRDRKKAAAAGRRSSKADGRKTQSMVGEHNRPTL
ncbi:MAG TPA: KGG domain-containing protein [Patescibacteria group bacterium]|nr:KGG domain-containing protein [Patescibacteria group bacterium]